MAENEEYPKEEDQIAKRIEQVIARIQNLRRPFRQRRQAIIDGILRGMERRSYERYRAYRVGSNPTYEEDETAKLKAEVEKLKKEKEEMEQELYWRRQSRGKAWLE